MRTLTQSGAIHDSDHSRSLDVAEVLDEKTLEELYEWFIAFDIPEADPLDIWEASE